MSSAGNRDRGGETGGSGVSYAVPRARREGRGPAIWLAGDPADLVEWMPLGITGIVTNTVVLHEMVKKYGQLTDVVKRYLDITDKPVVVEIDGNSVEELLEVGCCFTRMSDQVILKIPCNVNGLKAFAALREEGVETFCTTVFSLTQGSRCRPGRRQSHSTLLRTR